MFRQPPNSCAAARLQDGRAEPLGRRQRHFNVEAVSGNRAATSDDCAIHPIFHAIEMQVQLLAGKFVAGAAAQEDPQRLAQASIVFVVGSEIPEHFGHPLPRVVDVTAEQRSRRQTGVRRGYNGGHTLPAAMATPRAASA